ncbi:MAG TPA: DUF3300 domain-containing protein, partial [Xanthobacteraceae bacterium]|nr:DUF3300 domain-containing protein [Xanthobacteraceae bacterium]
NATPECHCIIQTSGDQITILPSEPKLVCIPVYNPRYVYGTWWEPAYPPIIFPVPVGFVYAPGFWISFEPPIEVVVFGPLWGWGWFDWPGHRIIVDNAVFGRLDPNRAAFAGGIWVHDPAHRRGIAYASAAVGARFGAPVRPTSIAVLRGAPATIGGRFVAAQAAGTLNGAGRGFVGHPGMVSHDFVGHGGPGAFHASSFAHSAAPQLAHGHTAPAHFSPGGGPHVTGFANGPVGGGPHGVGPGGGGHHH